MVAWNEDLTKVQDSGLELSDRVSKIREKHVRPGVALGVALVRDISSDQTQDCSDTGHFTQSGLGNLWTALDCGVRTSAVKVQVAEVEQ